MVGLSWNSAMNCALRGGACQARDGVRVAKVTCIWGEGAREWGG